MFYHDGSRDNGGIREVVAIDVPDELGEYFIAIALASCEVSQYRNAGF